MQRGTGTLEVSGETTKRYDMILVRVDDRLLHGQVITSWVPSVRADLLIVACDNAYNDRVMRSFIESFAHRGLRVLVKRVEDAIEEVVSGAFVNARIMFIVSTLKDALKVYESGIRFTAINIGNVHHDMHGRKVTPSVTLDEEDERIIERFKRLGIAVDFHDLPTDVHISCLNG